MTTARQEFRQHSKSTLVRAAATVFRERQVLLAIERRRWLRRCGLVAAVALLAGLALGVAVGRMMWGT